MKILEYIGINNNYKYLSNKEEEHLRVKSLITAWQDKGK